jgi:hypothetical protein
MIRENSPLARSRPGLDRWRSDDGSEPLAPGWWPTIDEVNAFTARVWGYGNGVDRGPRFLSTVLRGACTYSEIHADPHAGYIVHRPSLDRPVPPAARHMRQAAVRHIIEELGPRSFTITDILRTLTLPMTRNGLYGLLERWVEVGYLARIYRAQGVHYQKVNP